MLNVKFSGALTGACLLSLGVLFPPKAFAQTIQTTCSNPRNDVNQDGVVNLFDVSILSQNFLQTPVKDARADINQDGKVDLIDFHILQLDLLRQCTHPSPTPSVSPSPSPSPTSVPPSLSPSPSTQPSATPEPEITNFTISLSGEGNVTPENFRNIPDTHLSFIKTDHDFRIWRGGTSGRGWLMLGSSLNTIQPYKKSGDTTGLESAVLFASGVTDKKFTWDQHYAGFSSVIPTSQSGKYLGFYHAELDWKGSPKPSIGSVGLAVSTDFGVTWEKIGRVVQGTNRDKKETFSGAAVPAAVIVQDQGKEYIYLYYSNFPQTGVAKIHLVRSLRDRNGALDSWQKYTANGWVAKSEDKNQDDESLEAGSIPIFSLDRDDVENGMSTNFDVSYNNYLKKYLATFKAQKGFYYMVSPDGIHWEKPTLLLASPNTFRDDTPGGIKYHYPAMLSDSESSSLTTGRTGYLYYAREVVGQPHYMYRRTFTIVPK